MKIILIAETRSKESYFEQGYELGKRDIEKVIYMILEEVIVRARSFQQRDNKPLQTSTLEKIIGKKIRHGFSVCADQALPEEYKRKHKKSKEQIDGKSVKSIIKDGYLKALYDNFEEINAKIRSGFMDSDVGQSYQQDQVDQDKWQGWDEENNQSASASNAIKYGRMPAEMIENEVLPYIPNGWIERNLNSTEWHHMGTNRDKVYFYAVEDVKKAYERANIAA